ncbi:hypothetical protein E4T56_gene6864 [Termitomyces sp. T112]|nr:hypothetical protein E4T56_gene6864 [Termitomyces sp. T112]
MTGIVTGKIPALNLEERKNWDRSDGMLSGYIYRRVSDGYQYLVEECETGTAAWAVLKAHFKKSTIGNQMIAHAAFYQIDNTKFKNVLLMHLNDFFHTVCLSILAQSPEPDLAKIKEMLASSAATDPVNIKSEDALAA